MLITQEIVEKYFYKLYDSDEYEITYWKDKPQYSRVDVDWLPDYPGDGDRESIMYSTIIEGEREEKLNKLLNV